MGTVLAPPMRSYRVKPPNIITRSHMRWVSGKMKRSGLTRCGARVDMFSSRSRSDSATRRKSNIAR